MTDSFLPQESRVGADGAQDDVDDRVRLGDQAEVTRVELADV
jgi:hypothetical protein